jgi:pantetheine-phosphate adenylyltransferase
LSPPEIAIHHSLIVCLGAVENKMIADHHTAVYTGSFDPITLGHLNVIERSAKLFDRLIVGVGINVDKTALFTPDERVELVKKVTRSLENVEVMTFEGLAVNFVRQMNSRIMVRGVRPLTDIAAEMTMMLANRQLDEDVETVFLMADKEFSHVSSSLIKQITRLASDEVLSKFVPAEIVPLLRERTNLKHATGK